MGTQIDLVVVDGPNLFSAVGRELKVLGGADGEVRAYLRDWCDVDRLLAASIPSIADASLGIVMFHAPRRRVGPKDWGLDGSTEADLFWGRQAALPNCSSIGVEVPGHQQESYPFKCKNCGLQHDVVTTTEKGIDTSMTTYLLETAERWQTAVVVTRDVDLVPPVLALRRKGKRVFVVADAHDPPSALARACQQFVPINSDFLAEELGTFRLCREDGVFEKLHGTQRDEQYPNALRYCSRVRGELHR